jgi:hypothetical protein
MPASLMRAVGRHLSKSAPLRNELKVSLWPFLERAGFVRGRSTSLFTPFSRHTTDMVHVCEIQWDKYHRPHFVVNFGEVPMARLSNVPPHEIVKGELINHSDHLLRLKCRKVLLGSKGSWYGHGKPLWEKMTTLRWNYTPAQVAAMTIDHFAEVEEWWRTKRIGPHIVEIRSTPNRVAQQTHAARRDA